METWKPGALKTRTTKERMLLQVLDAYINVCHAQFLSCIEHYAKVNFTLKNTSIYSARYLFCQASPCAEKNWS